MAASLLGSVDRTGTLGATAVQSCSDSDAPGTVQRVQILQRKGQRSNSVNRARTTTNATPIAAIWAADKRFAPAVNPRPFASTCDRSTKQPTIKDNHAYSGREEVTGLGHLQSKPSTGVAYVDRSTKVRVRFEAVSEAAYSGHSRRQSNRSHQLASRSSDRPYNRPSPAVSAFTVNGA